MIIGPAFVEEHLPKRWVIERTFVIGWVEIVV